VEAGQRLCDCFIIHSVAMVNRYCTGSGSRIIGRMLVTSSKGCCEPFSLPSTTILRSDIRMVLELLVMRDRK
jgi:hypothetical protein